MPCAMFFLLLFIGYGSAFPDKDNNIKHSLKLVGIYNNGDVVIKDTENLKHYIVSTQKKKNFTATAKICVGYSMQVLRVDNSKQQGIVRALVMEFATQGRFWIGARKIGEDWKWVDRSSIRRFFWDEEEPSNAKGSEECIAVNYEDATWSVQACDDEVYYICEAGPGYRPDLIPLIRRMTEIY